MNDKPCVKCGSTERYKPTRGRAFGNCKACRKVRGAKYHKENRESLNAYGKKYRIENPEKEKARSSKYRAENPKKEKARRAKYLSQKGKGQLAKESIARWQRNNPDKVRAYFARWKNNNHEKLRAAQEKWKSENPDKVREHWTKRRARVSNAAGNITAAEWDSLVAHYGGACLCCGRGDVKMTLDHIVPLAKGGDHTIDNAQPLCKLCNCKKSAKTIDYRPDAGPKRWKQTALAHPTDL